HPTAGSSSREDPLASLPPLVSIRAAPALGSAVEILRRTSLVSAELESRSLPRVPPWPGRQSEKLSSAASWQASRHIGNNVGWLKRRSTASDGIRDARRHAVQLSAVIHSYTRDFHGDGRGGRRSKLAHRRRLRGVWRTLEA